jgi:hypothetical protein
MAALDLWTAIPGHDDPKEASNPVFERMKADIAEKISPELLKKGTYFSSGEVGQGVKLQVDDILMLYQFLARTPDRTKPFLNPAIKPSPEMTPDLQDAILRAQHGGLDPGPNKITGRVSVKFREQCEWYYWSQPDPPAKTPKPESRGRATK